MLTFKTDDAMEQTEAEEMYEGSEEEYSDDALYDDDEDDYEREWCD